MHILLPSLYIIVGFVGLIWSAERFVLGASTTARNLGVSPLIIGLTIVAFGTSAPEIFTSGVAALKGSGDLAVGNVLGSNIVNIGLVLGITALAYPITLPVSLLRKEVPALLMVSLILLWLFHDLRLDWLDGVLLLVVLAALGYRVLRQKHGITDTHLSEEEEVSDYLADISTARALWLMLLGLTLMVVSSNILVDGAKAIALGLGMSELAVGLTIVAIGTSLPELATSLASVRKGHHDLAMGNIIGSNILNILMVLPVPALLAPMDLEQAVLWRDYGAMMTLTVLLALMVWLLRRQGRPLGRAHGAILLFAYMAYTAYLIYSQ